MRAYIFLLRILNHVDCHLLSLSWVQVELPKSGRMNTFTIAHSVCGGSVLSNCKRCEWGLFLICSEKVFLEWQRIGSIIYNISCITYLVHVWNYNIIPSFV